jgi:hypothetical protein
MNRYQLENLYEVNSLVDYRLKTTIDLLKTHGIDFTEIDGYSRLDDLNRSLYEKFIVNFFNGWGLEARATIIPKGIYYVEDYDLLVKENPENDYYNVAGGVVLAIDRNGIKTVHKTWSDPDYAHLTAAKEDKHRIFLRFEYERDDRPEWLHVMSSNDWY